MRIYRTGMRANLPAHGAREMGEEAQEAGGRRMCDSLLFGGVGGWRIFSGGTNNKQGTRSFPSRDRQR